MLYTTRPLERIYADPSTFDYSRAERPTDSSGDEFQEVELPSGRIITRREGEKYVIEKVNSTDMKDYLNDQYVPGKSIKK